MTTLFILYDGSCGLCARAVRKLITEPSYLTLRFAPATSPFAREHFPTLLDGAQPDEVFVVADSGEVYRGPSAWIMVLYALRRYRPLAMRMASPTWRPLASRVIEFVGRHRRGLSDFLGLNPETQALRTLHSSIADGRPISSSLCADGACNPLNAMSERALIEDPPRRSASSGVLPDPETPLDRLIRTRQTLRNDWTARAAANVSGGPPRDGSPASAARQR